MRISFPLLSVVFVASFVRLHGQTIYSNDFQTDTAGFVASGTIAGGLTRVSLPTDSAGMSSANQSMWLGKLGAGVAKSTTTAEILTLSISGLTNGALYSVRFDLLIGSSWDGAAGGFGPDSWRFKVDGVALVDTVFSDYTGSNMGADSRGYYTDSNYASPSGPLVMGFTGADAHWVSGSTDYSNDYGIYYFGHGAGNPVLTFTASGTTATLEFARYNPSNTDSPDEYWAIDNVAVAAIPETQTGTLVAGLAAVGCGVLRRRFRRRWQTNAFRHSFHNRGTR